MKINMQDMITNHRRFKVKFNDNGERRYELNKDQGNIFFYDVYNRKEKLGFTRVGLNQKFIEKFPFGQAYTIGK